MKPVKIIVLVCAAALAASSAHAQFSHTHTVISTVAVPTAGSGGSPGGISNPSNAASLSLDFPDAVAIEHVSVSLFISHQAVGDLRIELSHCGVNTMLYNQSPASLANLDGTYGFDDMAPTAFTAAVAGAPAAGSVPVGTYQPSGAMGAFVGMNSAGPWTATVYDLAANNIGGMFQITVTVDGADPYQTPPTFSLIPDGGGGLCLSPVMRVIDIPQHGIVDDLTVQIFFAHTWVSDLDITIQHAGVSVTLSEYLSPPCSADASGGYTFWDGSVFSWTAAEAAYSGTQMIPTGTYRPKQPLSAFAGLDQYGPWFITLCDRAAQDTGSLGGVALQISHQFYNLTLSQPNGPASIQINNFGGAPGDTFVNLFTLSQGSAPAGWILGLDISVADLVSQLSFGSPFIGTLGPCGGSLVTIPGPIPSGLTLWAVSLELDATMTPVRSKPVFTYTTQ